MFSGYGRQAFEYDDNYYDKEFRGVCNIISKFFENYFIFRSTMMMKMKTLMEWHNHKEVGNTPKECCILRTINTFHFDYAICNLNSCQEIVDSKQFILVLIKHMKIDTEKSSKIQSYIIHTYFTVFFPHFHSKS